MRRAFVLVLALFFAGLGVRYALKVADDRSAFRRWQPQILELEKGTDIAARFDYPNPPIMAVLLEPLAHLPPLVGALLWFALKLGMALLAVYWVFALIETPQRPFPGWAKALAFLLALKPIAEDLDHGNVNLFILFLVVAALHALRHHRDLLGGGLIGLAIACKVTPALFVPYLAWKRQWRALAGVGVGLALFLYPGFVPALRLGLDDNQRMLASWYRGMVEPFVVGGQVTSEHNNQSLPGLVFRLATDSPSFSAYHPVTQAKLDTRFDNVASLDPAQAKWLVKGLMGLFALLIVAACRTPMEERRGWRIAAEYGLVVLGMLLFSERTWKHHCVTLVLPVAVVCYVLATQPLGPVLRRGLVGLLVLVVLLTLSTSLPPGRHRGLDPQLVQPGPGKLAQVYGAYTLACLLLAGGMVVLLRRREGRTGAPGAVEGLRAAA